MTLCTEAAVEAVVARDMAHQHQRVFTLPRQQSFTPPQVLNPFVQEQRLSAKDKYRAVLLGIILLPLRVSCMLLILIVAWPFAFLATSCSYHKGIVPLVGWKRSVPNISLRFLGRALFFVMGFRVKVRGEPASRAEAPIFAVAPHSTFFDGIACVIAGLPSIVSRTENLRVPILGRILQSLQPIVVSRVDPNSRNKTINEISKRATSEDSWPQVLIFPEGTCTNRSCLITFKQGAFIPGAPVQPVVLRYPNKKDTVSWTWQGNTFLEALILTLCQLYTNVEIEFLPVYRPTFEEKNSPALFANHVRLRMANVLGVPVTDHTYEDCRLMISAGQLTLPMEAGLVEFTKISKKLNLNWASVRDQLDQFAAVASASKGGRIRIDEFARYLKLPVSDVLEELFALFDRNGDGTIDFREYVIGLSVLCNPANTEETIHMAFQLFDLDNDGVITEDEFASVVRSSLGLPDLDVSKLFKEIDADKTHKLSYEEFKDFALKHPEYAKLFTTYLELQRCQVQIPSEVNDPVSPAPKTPVSKKISGPSNKIYPQNSEDDNAGSLDKKDD
ncbi:lysophosphatidylcholine acyltransferase 2 [Sphaerodactylus townsendi]|uniref:lysophosphatidylcholine acyltransferase 2 n=1 Tax=Sphaerodactylus townsendi TaxID=933632 RepID=UPI002026A666|nr:lysophosphatidylcholine acyltransferase 2 [Sphaerodactylus townsendi]